MAKVILQIIDTEDGVDIKWDGFPMHPQTGLTQAQSLAFGVINFMQESILDYEHSKFTDELLRRCIAQKIH